jgi:hypothetical protein
MKFSVGQKVRVKSHKGYKKYEGYTGPTLTDMPEIGKIYRIFDIDVHPSKIVVLWLDNKLELRGIYSEDVVDATTKLDKVLK